MGCTAVMSCIETGKLCCVVEGMIRVTDSGCKGDWAPFVLRTKGYHSSSFKIVRVKYQRDINSRPHLMRRDAVLSIWTAGGRDVLLPRVHETVLEVRWRLEWRLMATELSSLRSASQSAGFKIVLVPEYLATNIRPQVLFYTTATAVRSNPT